MLLYAFYKRHIWLLRTIALFFMGLIVAFIIALQQMNLETLRGNILSVLRDATNMPVEIDGKISWKFSLRPQIELNSVRIPNAEWAKNKNLFSADKIDVRMDVFSLFSSHPAIRYIKIHNAKIALEKNNKDENSIIYNAKQKPEIPPYAPVREFEKFPVSQLPFGGLEIQNVSANIYGDVYELNTFGIHNYKRDDSIEYAGWVKPYNNNLPFVIQFFGYNESRKIYPVRIAFATGADALIADIALEGKSKLPIDFVVRGDIPNIKKSGNWFNVDILQLPKMKVNIAGGISQKKISLKKSTIKIGNSELGVSGSYDWSANVPMLKVDFAPGNINIYKSFPEWFGAGKEWIHPNRELNVFHDMPLMGKYLYKINADINFNWKRFVIYRSLDLADMKVKIIVRDHKLRADVNTEIAAGNVKAVIIANIDENGTYTAQGAANGEHIYIGDILKEIYVDNIISGLPVDLKLYVQARGKDMSEIMQTMTGPVTVYSTEPGYAHADLVEYMYGGDFLTSLRHNVEDLFTGKKRDMIEISGAVVNVKLRNGLIETQNGVAVETHVINTRLAGMLDLGKEKIDLSLTTVPVRGLKLSLSGNVVNSLQITGNLAEPDFKLNGVALAGKVGSAVGLGLLLSPFTGGLSIAGGLVAGLLAGDLLESWLADEHPYKTALNTQPHRERDDPYWLNMSAESLSKQLLETSGE